MNYTMILLSGGTGSRMRNTIPKQYMLFAGKPMIMHTLEKADRIDAISKIIVVCMPEYKDSINLMARQYDIKKNIVFAQAGNSRQESALSGLRMADTESVIIHEAARPLVTLEDYQALINAENSNATFGLEIPFTVIKGHENVEGLLTRSELVNVQLPQKFETGLLLDAHTKALEDKAVFTEDASLLYTYHPDTKIKILTGSEYNIKMTTRTDIIIGEKLYDEVFRRRK